MYYTLYPDEFGKDGKIMKVDQKLISKYLEEAKTHYKLDLNIQIAIRNQKYDYETDYPPISFDSTKNEIVFCQKKYHKIAENLEFVMFHELGHAVETESFGRKHKFFFDIYNLSNSELSNGRKRNINRFFGLFTDWSINKYLNSIDKKIPYKDVKKHINNIVERRNNNLHFDEFFNIHYIGIYFLSLFGETNYPNELNPIIEVLNEKPQYQLFNEYLDKINLLDYNSKINYFPIIFNGIIKPLYNDRYSLELVKLRKDEVLLKSDKPDYLLLNDKENSIWTTFEIRMI
jgi:hypothetical protein